MTVVKTDGRIGQELDSKGHWEFNDFLQIIDIFEKFYSRSRGAILDIGANVGTWVVPLSRRYPDRKIIAIECQQLLTDCLISTIKHNNLQNIDVKWAAVSDTCSKLNTKNIDYQWGANFGAFELQAPMSNSDWNGQMLDQTIQIDQITVDSLNLAGVDLIKLDIEGMEHLALLGAQHTLKSFRPMIAYEYHKTDQNTINQLLTSCNYMRYNSIGQMHIMVPREKI
jgi:FkbM family methyltransferase